MPARMLRMAAPALIFLTACQSLDPTLAYREAARNLKFSLSKVEPHLDLAFPLERSRLRVSLHLGVENASALRLVAKVLGGTLTMKLGEATHTLGLVGFPAGLDLAPGGRSEAVAEIVFDYNALKTAWGPLMKVVQRHQAATWHLEGEAKVEVLGFPITLPLRATAQSGN